MTITVTAHCLRCAWAAAGDWPEVDRAAERHARAGHPTATMAKADGRKMHPAYATIATTGGPRS